MTHRTILICGLSRSGKTTQALKLIDRLQLNNHGAIQYCQQYVNCQHINGDDLRKKFNDWDFSRTGRLRQAERVNCQIDLTSDYTIIDIIAPLIEQRKAINPDFIIWMDTLQIDFYNGSIPFEEVKHPRLFRITNHKIDRTDFIVSILQDHNIYNSGFWFQT